MPTICTLFIRAARRAKRWSGALLCAVVAVSPVSGAFAKCEDPQLQRIFAQPGYIESQVPTLAPDIEFVREDGTQGKLSDYKGRPVFVVFWATWCTACHAEMPALDAMINDYREEDIVFLPLSLDTTQAQAERYLKGKGFENIASHLDSNMQIFNDMCFIATPTHAIIDREGLLKEIFIGAVPWEDPSARQYIQSLIDRS